MSYEGYDYFLCENGHKITSDALDVMYGEFNPKCPKCDAPSHYLSSVDQTNGEDVGIILDEDWKKWELTPKVTKQCPACNHTSVKQEATYRRPSPSELSKAQKIYSRGEYVPLHKEEECPEL